MGRTATAFLVLIAMGGCVADYQGPPAAYQTSQNSQPAAASCYATWSKSDQFAVLHDSLAATSPPMAAQTAAVPPLAPVTPAPSRVTAAGPKMLPTPVPLPNTVIAEALPSFNEGVTPPPPLPSETMVDPDLARATMVQAPNQHPEIADPNAIKAPLKTLLAKKTDADQEAPASGSTSAPIRMVNTKRVTLNYELKDMDNSGISGVELWRTRDAHSWERGEIVAQTNHSFSVEVKDEGLHGFTLLARNGADAGKEGPIPGDQPQVWVMVDFTKPVVQITGVEVAHSGKNSNIQIHWTARDKNLGFRPITLSYAEQSDGPWTKIAAGVENSGQYEWQPPAGAPHHVFVRVEAADMAGNVASVQTPNALRLDTTVVVAAPPPSALTPVAEFAHKPLAAPVAPEAPHPSVAILGVEPNGN